ncbi:unnamed protein product [Sphacelaria rigidula]
MVGSNSDKVENYSGVHSTPRTSLATYVGFSGRARENTCSALRHGWEHGVKASACILHHRTWCYNDHWTECYTDHWIVNPYTVDFSVLPRLFNDEHPRLRFETGAGLEI